MKYLRPVTFLSILLGSISSDFGGITECFYRDFKSENYICVIDRQYQFDIIGCKEEGKDPRLCALKMSKTYGN